MEMVKGFQQEVQDISGRCIQSLDPWHIEAERSDPLFTFQSNENSILSTVIEHKPTQNRNVTYSDAPLSSGLELHLVRNLSKPWNVHRPTPMYMVPIVSQSAVEQEVGGQDNSLIDSSYHYHPYKKTLGIQKTCKDVLMNRGPFTDSAFTMIKKLDGTKSGGHNIQTYGAKYSTADIDQQNTPLNSYENLNNTTTGHSQKLNCNMHQNNRDTQEIPIQQDSFHEQNLQQEILYQQDSFYQAKPQQDLLYQQDSFYQAKPQQDLLYQQDSFYQPNPQQDVLYQQDSFHQPKSQQDIAYQQDSFHQPKPQQDIAYQQDSFHQPKSQQDIAYQQDSFHQPKPQQDIAYQQDSFHQPKPQQDIAYQQDRFHQPKPQQDVLYQQDSFHQPKPQQDKAYQQDSFHQPKPQQDIAYQQDSFHQPKPQQDIAYQLDSFHQPKPQQDIAYQQDSFHQPKPQQDVLYQQDSFHQPKPQQDKAYQQDSFHQPKPQQDIAYQQDSFHQPKPQQDIAYQQDSFHQPKSQQDIAYQQDSFHQPKSQQDIAYQQDSFHQPKSQQDMLYQQDSFHQPKSQQDIAYQQDSFHQPKPQQDVLYQQDSFHQPKSQQDVLYQQDSFHQPKSQQDIAYQQDSFHQPKSQQDIAYQQDSFHQTKSQQDIAYQQDSFHQPKSQHDIAYQQDSFHQPKPQHDIAYQQDSFHQPKPQHDIVYHQDSFHEPNSQQKIICQQEIFHEPKPHKKSHGLCGRSFKVQKPDQCLKVNVLNLPKSNTLELINKSLINDYNGNKIGNTVELVAKQESLSTNKQSNLVGNASSEFTTNKIDAKSRPQFVMETCLRNTTDAYTESKRYQQPNKLPNISAEYIESSKLMSKVSVLGNERMGNREIKDVDVSNDSISEEIERYFNYTCSGMSENWNTPGMSRRLCEDSLVSKSEGSHQSTLDQTRTPEDSLSDCSEIIPFTAHSAFNRQTVLSVNYNDTSDTDIFEESPIKEMISQPSGLLEHQNQLQEVENVPKQPCQIFMNDTCSSNLDNSTESRNELDGNDSSPRSSSSGDQAQDQLDVYSDLTHTGDNKGSKSDGHLIKSYGETQENSPQNQFDLELNHSKDKDCGTGITHSNSEHTTTACTASTSHTKYIPIKPKLLLLKKYEESKMNITEETENLNSGEQKSDDCDLFSDATVQFVEKEYKLHNTCMNTQFGHQTTDGGKNNMLLSKQSKMKTNSKSKSDDTFCQQLYAGLETSSESDQMTPTQPEDLESCESFYWCHVCEKTVRTEEECIKHYSLHNNQSKVNLWYYYLRVYGHVTKHWRGYNASEKCVYLCGLCERTIPYLHGFKRHILKHGNKVHCDVCDKSFESQDNLKKHKHTHKEKKIYSCTDCGKSFTSKGSYNMHKHSYHNHENFECQYCGKILSSKGSLTTHTRLHTGNNPYKCSFCDRSYPQNVQLKLHMKTHRRQGDFKSK